jgi:hypothetical protein
VLYADILSMAKTHDYDADTGKGASKLLVFVDSLSRWVEAIPLHRDPTSSQILDLFMEHVVSRHGVPRCITTDQGSNLASRLCAAVLGATGVDLSATGAEHHEGVGAVERFQQTLVGMTRAADDGGSHWVDHLPFLLMSYRATPHRVTEASPAFLLYGRELRLPAQIHNLVDPTPDDSPANASTRLSASPSEDAPSADPDGDALAYGRRLHRMLVFAWRAARDATRNAQGATVADTVRTAAKPPQYQVGDRVARRLHDSANKLEYTYAGPYRIDAVMGNGRYRLTDLENNHTVKEFDVSNLRPYHTHVDADPLHSDEYLVDEILDRRGYSRQRQYRVKWRGYPRSQSTWEPRAELERRCVELLTAFDAARDRARIRHPAVAPPPPDAAPTDPPDRPTTPDAAVDPTTVPSHLPHTARFERGQWFYGRHITGPRGIQLRMLPARNFTDAELASDHFAALRHEVSAAFPPHLVAAASSQPSFRNRLEFSPDDLPHCRHAAKVWFTRTFRGAPQLLSFVRADSDDARPQYDTFGGKMDPVDRSEYHRCALRELREEVALPKPWNDPLGLELASFSRGHRLVNLTGPAPDRHPHRQALWLIHLEPDLYYRTARPTANGEREMKPGTLQWRPATDVIENLNSFSNVGRPVARALDELLTEQEEPVDA